MNTSLSVSTQRLREDCISGGIYVATDGMLRFCVTGPVMELPIDFKEWYQAEAEDVAADRFKAA
ncbi:hypothetical protein BJL95_08005 [Methylomonas sp. LWB]|nr:hypothetical protein BJL95_08005 [Methylomonas sp. LWB]